MTEGLSTFNDDCEIPVWASKYVARAQELGIVEGDQNKNFNPDRLVSRVEIAAMTQRAYDLKRVTNDPIGFDDAEAIPDRGKDSVAAVVDHDIMQGVPGNKFAPKENAMLCGQRQQLHY